MANKAGDALAVTFTGQPADFDVLAVIGTAEVNYVFFRNLAASSTTDRVLVGATLANTVANLAAAINNSGLSGTTYSSDVVANPDISALVQTDAVGHTLILQALNAGTPALGTAFQAGGTTIPITMPGSYAFNNSILILAPFTTPLVVPPTVKVGGAPGVVGSPSTFTPSPLDNAVMQRISALSANMLTPKQIGAILRKEGWGKPNKYIRRLMRYMGLETRPMQ